MHKMVFNAATGRQMTHEQANLIKCQVIAAIQLKYYRRL